MHLIYIAHSYSAPTHRARLKNVEKAMDAAIQLYYHGFMSICPNLFHYLDERAEKIGKPLRWADYMLWDLVLLARCDGLLYLGKSPGTDTELRFAQRKGMPVFYSIEEIISHYKSSNGTDIAAIESNMSG